MKNDILYIKTLAYKIILSLSLLLCNQVFFSFDKDFMVKAYQNKSVEQAETRKVGQYTIIIKYKNFDKSNHRLKFSDRIVTKIDNKKYYGTDGTVPFREISSIKLLEQEKEYIFPPNQYKSLFEPHLGKEYYSSAFSVKESSLYLEIALSGGDAAGSYDVKWLVFKKDKTIKREISDIGVLNKIRKPEITISKLQEMNKNR